MVNAKLARRKRTCRAFYAAVGQSFEDGKAGRSPVETRTTKVFVVLSNNVTQHYGGAPTELLFNRTIRDELPMLKKRVVR